MFTFCKINYSSGFIDDSEKKKKKSSYDRREVRAKNKTKKKKNYSNEFEKILKNQKIIFTLMLL